MQNDLFKPAAPAETRDSETGSDEAVSCKELLGITSNSSQPPKKKSAAWDYHRQPDGKDEWLTPPPIIWALSESFNGEKFDLDPCAPITRPWEMAKAHYTTEDNGMLKPWHGRVWCNPPYREAADWLARCADHGNAIAMVFARTETRMFFDCVWNTADAVLFLKGRVTFFNVDGSKPKGTGGGPSCLVAWGDCNVDALEHAVQECGIEGKLIYLCD